MEEGNMMKLTRDERIKRYTEGRPFTLIAKTPINEDFQCDVCGGSGNHYYKIEDKNGTVGKVGKTCLQKHCGVSL